MPFFPEFTDHGPDHLRRVLDTADWLIAEDTWNVLSPRDAACLVIAILIHDSAMHLTEDSLRVLVRGNPSEPFFPEFDLASWHQLWSDYLLEAKHWEPKRCDESRHFLLALAHSEPR